MATVQQVRDLRAEGAPADRSPESDAESPSMKAARELGYTASAFPDEDIEPVFGRPRTPQPYDYAPPPNLLEALRGARSGVYGGPLRLLAVEVHDRLSADGVACGLLTGQERRLVEGASHLACTVEMCSTETPVEVAVLG